MVRVLGASNRGVFLRPLCRCGTVNCVTRRDEVGSDKCVTARKEKREMLERERLGATGACEVEVAVL